MYKQKIKSHLYCFVGLALFIFLFPISYAADEIQNKNKLNSSPSAAEKPKSTESKKEMTTASNVKVVISQLVSEDRSEIRKAIEVLQNIADPIAIKALKMLKEKRIRKSKAGLVVIVNDDETEAFDYYSGKKVSVKIEELITPRVNSPIRSAADTAIYSIQLFSKSEADRYAAAKELASASEPQSELEAIILKALKAEKSNKVKQKLVIIISAIDFVSGDDKRKIAALKVFTVQEHYPAKDLLEELLKKNKEGAYVTKNEKLRASAQNLLNIIERGENLITASNLLLEGLSVGSILLIAALGLAITFGLMGVINMAHGEMIMLGAFTAYSIQQIFITFIPSLAAYYLLLAIPCAFVVSALVGIGIERTVVRRLYGRPLDTLLATWGVSLLVFTAVKLTFGSNNVKIEAPDFLQGSITLFSGVSLSYARVTVILFAVFVMIAVWTVMRRTSFGLKMRAVTQNRNMASSMGIATKKIDMWAFGLGSGIAGLAGVAISQIDLVGYRMGQGYIIMCFLVVVIGGVGNLSGLVIGAVIVGIVSKLIELWVGANMTDFALLAFVVLFIQFRPQGLFPQKGRAAEN